MNQIRNSQGRLTPYAFACGYVEQKETQDKRITLWHENGVFHVRAHNFAEHCRLFWECFDSLPQARRFFDKQSSVVCV